MPIIVKKLLFNLSLSCQQNLLNWKLIWFGESIFTLDCWLGFLRNPETTSNQTKHCLFFERFFYGLDSLTWFLGIALFAVFEKKEKWQVRTTLQQIKTISITKRKKCQYSSFSRIPRSALLSLLFLLAVFWANKVIQ